MSSASQPHRSGTIGNVNHSFWTYDSDHGFDLTRSEGRTSSQPNDSVKIDTSTQSIRIDPAKSALVIIDMQNFFLSTALGREPDSLGLQAQKQLLDVAIPAARAMGMRIIWMNWGLTREDLYNMPPAMVRTFGFQTVEVDQSDMHSRNLPRERDPYQSGISNVIETSGKDGRLYVGLGNSLGRVVLSDGTVQDAGNLLIRGQWNAALTPELNAEYERGLTYNPPDAWVNKNRLSGLWNSTTEGVRFLEREGLTTLFFAGVETDQCVWTTWLDASFRGYDCILLTDACATSGPDFAKQCTEYNASNFGFCTNCEMFSRWQRSSG